MKSVLLIGLVVCLIGVVYGDPLLLTGVNSAGAEFGGSSGTVNFDYVYPDLTTSAHLRSLGMNVFRVPFKWERMQPILNAALNTSELGYLTRTVNNFTGSGSYVVLDPHNYAGYRGNKISANGNVTFDNFAYFWQLLSQTFQNNPRVIFGLMNEPSGIRTDVWFQAANAAIAAIRQTGAKNLILVPGTGYTGAHWWVSGGYGGAPNAQYMTNISDPLNYFAFEVHQYFDSDYSGTNDTCRSVDIGVRVMNSFTNWCRTNGFKAFVGEFAGGNNAVCQQCVTNFLSFLQNNSDIYLGWTYWAAGPWWGNYMFSVEPTRTNGTWIEKPQTSWLQPFLARTNSVIPDPSSFPSTIASSNGATSPSTGASTAPSSPGAVTNPPSTGAAITLSSWINLF